ncbi:MEKHLA domain-containing protein [Klebsiella sp. BIGb0407]|uniref:MEKHLA domain-containing protein n=1 Tax=Klebsiella sp. BIGb0407 TaxID=2940603 RepID=UPI0021687FA7|nr:MEKHLA domain-containing protein [Klebsiella sp. BIGb0407]MCS3429941.1 PAS domain-containing protein [Klebsiella sp. BIGb0407]
MTIFQDRALIERIADCYLQRAGVPLPSPENVSDLASWLDDSAPYSLLAHDSSADPRFIYANQSALKCFKYSREEMLQLPSRLSAATPDQQERQSMLMRLKTEGIVFGYSGVRITRQGEAFNIYQGVIWQLTDKEGKSLGQAALFWLTPEE